MSDALKGLSTLARLMVAQEDDVENTEALLTQKKAVLERLKRIDLPEAMRELGLSQITLDETGEVITVHDDVSASIPEKHRVEAFAWLIKRGYDGIIRTKVSIEYSRGDHDKAIVDAQTISQTLLRPTALDETIHPQTLRAFVRERMEAGDAIPMELFGIHPYSEAKVKRKKMR